MNSVSFLPLKKKMLKKKSKKKKYPLNSVLMLETLGADVSTSLCSASARVANGIWDDSAEQCPECERAKWRSTVINFIMDRRVSAAPACQNLFVQYLQVAILLMPRLATCQAPNASWRWRSGFRRPSRCKNWTSMTQAQPSSIPLFSLRAESGDSVWAAVQHRHLLHGLCHSYRGSGLPSEVRKPHKSNELSVQSTVILPQPCVFSNLGEATFLCQLC